VIVFKTNTGFSKLSGTPQPEVTNALGLDLMYQGNHSKNREYLQAMAFALGKSECCQVSRRTHGRCVVTLACT
jgi:hypothetical protein